jgi:hypothetical protein
MASAIGSWGRFYETVLAEIYNLVKIKIQIVTLYGFKIPRLVHNTHVTLYDFKIPRLVHNTRLNLNIFYFCLCKNIFG